MIKTYVDLDVYKEGYQLALDVYKITKNYPIEERYELISQFRRASTSIPMNIAEGYGRKSKLEFGRFLKMALGSCNEIQVILNFSKDLEYITKDKFEELTKKYEVLGRKLYKLENSVTNN